MSKLASSKILVSAVGAVLITSACAHFTPVAVSTTSLGPEHEIRLGIVTGTVVNGYLFGLPDGNEEGIRLAVQRAKLRLLADNLIDIYVDQRVTYFPLAILPIYTRVETIVTGTAVKYKDPTLNRVRDFTGPAETLPAPSPKPAAVSQRSL